MKTQRFLLALAPLLLAAACASSPFSRTTYPSADRPDEARAYSDFMIARFAALTNDPQVAARHYASAISTAPEDLGVAERAVFSALLAGDYGVAAGLARRANDAGSEAALVRLTLAVDAIARGKTEHAIEIIEASDLRAFNRMIARNLEAWSLLDTEGAAAAEAMLQQNLTGDARLDNATLHMLGLMQAAARNDAGAIQTFDRIWASGARLAVGAEAYAELLAASGERDKAVAILDQFRTEVGANAALGVLKTRIEAGETITPKRLTTRQGAALAMFLPASALMLQTDDDIASVYFVLAVALDPQLHQARTLLGQSLVQGKRPDAAIRVLSDVPASSPFYAAARGQIAGILLSQERPDEALVVAIEALKIKPERSLRLQVADLHRAQERYAEAEALLTEVMLSDEAEGRKDWRVFFLRGASRERQSNWESAETDLKEALAIDPHNANVLNYLGYSWIDRGINLEEGFSLIRQALVLEPQSGHIVDSLGWAHYQLGQYDEAVELLERAVELLPGDPVLNDHLGDAYWKAGRRKEAGFQWSRALKLDPQADDRVVIAQKLVTGLAAAPAPAGALVAQ
ncbi:tetratricopeptide repeat protein [Hyphomonas sp.]|uniref:tetratricopeptide repeat protein n=1 Tax=Hyphomonas sp. TaxID=87 RepID=UPI0025BC9CA5|nr:tetratricopeptide repeat protein [Hyphomonas sp.]